MTDETVAEHKIEALALWSKYEDIAMHFNDLLMRLRSQSLAGIAAISTLVGLFTKGASTTMKTDWLAAGAIFIGMALFWISIWCLDLLYYNRLLMGAVTEIRSLEKDLNGRSNIKVAMSTTIEEEFSRQGRFLGVTLFYGIVLITIFAGAIFSWCQYRHA